MIFKSIRGFSSIDFLTFVTSITAVAVVSGPILKRGMESDRVNQATKEMRLAASELIVRATVIPSKQLEDRLPASINPELPQGSAGLDPWGNTYNYRIIRNSYGQPIHVLIWSRGPNGEQETPEANLMDSKARVTQVAAVVFEGDDLGVLMSAR
jgi:hypothetical protein